MVVLVQRLTDLVLFGACVVAAIGIGLSLVRRWAPVGMSSLEALLFAYGVGLLTLAYGVFALGLLGWLHRTVLILWLALCFLGWFFGGWRFLREEKFSGRLWETLKMKTPFDRLCLLALLFLNLLTLLLCFVPPWQMEWDSLSYHLAVPKIYWLSGRIYYLPFTHHAQFPLTAQMLYLLGLGLTNLKGAGIAKLFHWSFFILCQGVLWAWGRVYAKGSQRASPLGPLAFAFMPLAFTEATTAYIDLALTAFSLLTLYPLVRFAIHPDRRWLVWAGVFSGAAAGTKYTGLVCLVLLFSLGWWALWRQRWPPFRPLTVSLLIGIVIASPWYVKNWLWTGNPVFPFAYSVFGGQHWSQKMAHEYRFSNREFGGSRDVLALALMPFHLTLNEVRWGRCARQWMRRCGRRGECPQGWKCGRFDNLDTPALSIGFLPLAFLVPFSLIAFTEGVPFSVALPFLSGLLFSLWWFLEAQYLRYLLPALGWMGVLIGYTGARWEQLGLIPRWVVRGVIIANILYGGAIALWKAKGLLPVVFGVISEGEFLRMTTPVYRVAEFVNGALPRGAVIATYGLPLGYYFDRRYFWADAGHNRLIRYELIQSLDGLIREWQRLGVTHVVIHWRYVPKGSPLGRWIERGKGGKKLSVLFSAGDIEVLALRKEARKL